MCSSSELNIEETCRLAAVTSGGAWLPRHTRRKTLMRVGVKYCGGCNPSYDRAKCVGKIQEAADDRIEWVFFDPAGVAALLLVSGCDRQCVETAQFERGAYRVIRIKDSDGHPSEILSVLLGEGEDP